MKKTSTRVLAGFLISLLALGGGLWFWRSAVIVKRTALAKTTIQNGLSAADFVSARSALPGIADPALRAAKEREIRVGELKSALAVRDRRVATRASSVLPRPKPASTTAAVTTDAMLPPERMPCMPETP